MQIRRSSFPSDAEVPPCPFDHEEGPCLYPHGFYKRYSHQKGTAKTRIFRFFCKLIGRTVSVLPDSFFPYRQIGVKAVETHFDRLSETEMPQSEDAQSEDAEAQDTAPASSEENKAALTRAWLQFCLSSRIESLKDFFGQRLPLTNSIRELWSAIRQTGGSLKQILLELASKGKSLLGDYRCLKVD
jgi:hypothetical protein